MRQTADGSHTRSKPYVGSVLMVISLLVLSAWAMQRLSRDGPGFEEGRPLIAGSILDEQSTAGSGYRWQICTSRALVQQYHTNESFGAGDADGPTFVTEVASGDNAGPSLTGYRYDQTGEYINNIVWSSPFNIEMIEAYAGDLADDPRYQPPPEGWRPYLSEYAQWLAIDTISASERERYERLDRLDPEFHVDDLRSLEGVIAAFDLGEATPTIRTDRNGSSYLRYEQPAAGQSQADGNKDSWGAAQLGYRGWVYGSAWVLDVWVEDGSAVQKIRLQTQEFYEQWAELRFAEGFDVGTLPGPGGPDQLGYGPSCPSTQSQLAESDWMGFEPWDPTIETAIDATLDPNGHPYDAASFGWVANPRLLGELTATDRTVFVSDAFFLADELGQGITVRVEFDGSTDLDVGLDAYLLEAEHDEYEGVGQFGIRLDVPGSSVDRWGDFETAYCTDGGTGRVSSWRSLQQEEDFNDRYFDDDVWFGDADDQAGNDTIVFFNGFGDGCFPMSKGLNSSGETVSLVVWNPEFPWRLMMPDGTPPADITQREAEIQECLDGTRAVEYGGYCSHD